MNIPKNFWNMSAAAVALLVVFLAAISIKTLKEIGYVGVSDQTVNTISVTGTGDAYAIPNIATFSFTVTATAKAVADAQTQATTEANAALAAVRAAGVADSDIQTQEYSISPHYEYSSPACPPTPISSGASYCPPGKQVLTGYDVSESVSVKLRDLTKAGSLLTSLGSAGVSDLNGPSFSVDNPDSVQAQARTLAINDAKAKAQALAGELGVSLVRVTGFTEDNGSPQPIMFAMNAGAVPSAAAAPTPQVPSGQQKVTSDVTITYEIQ